MVGPGSGAECALFGKELLLSLLLLMVFRVVVLVGVSEGGSGVRLGCGNYGRPSVLWWWWWWWWWWCWWSRERLKQPETERKGVWHEKQR